MDYVSLHNVSDQRGRGRFAFKNDITRIVSLGYDADQFFSVHHNQRADIFFGHFCHSIEYCGVWINGPNVPALLFKQMFYGHARPLDLLSELSVRVFKERYFLHQVGWATLI
jgi:hypothetical protein